jgi:DnaK suppressor protein
VSLSDGQLAHFEALLRERRRTLSDAIASSGSASKTVELDQTRQGRLSRMDAMQQQAMAQETQRRRELDIRRIDAALERIAAGEYGECLGCDAEIPAGRLEIDPAATLCVACAEKRNP